MTRLIPRLRPRRLGGSSFAILVLTVGMVGCATAATPGPASTASAAAAASVATAAPSAPATAPPSTAVTPAAGGGTAAAWCAFVIEINTKYGYMSNKNYSRTPPSLEVQRQIVTEALARLDEWISKTPSEIKGATDAEVAYFQKVKAYGDAHGWTDPTGFPQPDAAESTAMASLVPYSKTECGITFGK